MKSTGWVVVFLGCWLGGCAHLARQEEPEGPLAAAAREERPASPKEEHSFFTRLWDLDGESRTEASAIKQHRSNYFLPFGYNRFPNVDAVRAADPRKDLRKTEALFQVSFKIKLWEDVLGQDMDLWCGYTQRSFWQVYNFDDSSPFRETNYEPELLLNLRTDYKLCGLRGRFVNVGLNHQSNGQSEPLSRSWNRVVASAGLENGPFSLLLQGWYRVQESAEEDDNPRIESYLGYGELRADYFLGRHRLGLMLRNNLDRDHNRGAVQLEWSFPLFTRVAGYVQYFNGYGESLLDYDHRVDRIAAGFMLTM